MPIRDQLLAAIRRSGKSHYEISRATGIGQSVIGKFVDGKDIRLATAEKLAEYFGMRFTAATRNQREKRTTSKTKA